MWKTRVGGLKTSRNFDDIGFTHSELISNRILDTCKSFIVSQTRFKRGIFYMYYQSLRNWIQKNSVLKRRLWVLLELVLLSKTLSNANFFLHTTESLFERIAIRIWWYFDSKSWISEMRRTQNTDVDFQNIGKCVFLLSQGCVKSELTTPSINEVRMTFRKFWQPVFLCT